MAGANSREAKIKARMVEMGIYYPAFDDAIDSLAILERELSRARKEWKASKKPEEKHPSFSDPHYAIISDMEASIFKMRDALGLTPKGLQKLKGTAGPNSGTETNSVNHALDKLEELVGGYELPEDCS